MYAMFFQDLVGFKFHTMLSPLASRLSPLAVCAGLLLPLISLSAKAHPQSNFSNQSLSDTGSAKSGFYLSGMISPLDFDETAELPMRFAIGYDFSNLQKNPYSLFSYRLEAMYNRTTARFENTSGFDVSGDINSFMIKGYSDLNRGNPDARWIPYFGGGIGYTTDTRSVSDLNEEARADGLSYELNLGIYYKLNKSLDIYTQLSYIDHLLTIKEVKIDDQSIDISEFNIEVGDDIFDIGLGFRVRF